MTNKAAALLVAIQACDECGTRGVGRKATEEFKSKYARVANETIRALQAALAATTMEPDEDPDHYMLQPKRLRDRVTAVKELVTERHVRDVVVQGLQEKYRGIKLTT